MKVGDVCTRRVIIIEKNETVQEAAKLMRQHHVGDVVVVERHDGKNHPVGILTDRDIVVELLAEKVDLDAVTIGDAMSYELLTIKESDDLTDTLKRLSRKGVRRAPVVAEDGNLAGVVSADDLIEVFAELLRDLTMLISREQTREQLARSD
ncbi:CBS domain-containing protein [Methylophaga sp. OBS4]|uniref:CBS domain-containing protein n=1 Tax=Methylophaga sp. OBS4 TaxID=2991935 RepID=UPI00225B44E9|nr:CBS domain-containing protein [Methylophaga sp. OBS4]MCX4186940.1 CBS domain-containing protein [Methylophaga sp. OBS4]